MVKVERVQALLEACRRVKTRFSNIAGRANGRWQMCTPSINGRILTLILELGRLTVLVVAGRLGQGPTRDDSVPRDRRRWLAPRAIDNLSIITALLVMVT